MPGFADNLRRACEAAGITVAEAARRLGTKPADVEAWLEAGSLPELHVLVRLADAIGCRADDLLLGEDADFAHPQRRHAGLISARMGRVRVLLTQVRLARHRGELTLGHEAEIDEAALLATVEGCRAWVMSEDHDVGVAAAIEAELDGHLERVAAVLSRVQRTVASAFPPAVAVPGANGGSGEGEGAAPAPAGAGAETPETTGAAVQAPAVPRPRGHRSTLWAHDFADQQHECVMITRPAEVDVQLLVDDQVLETRTCRTLDEAFQQSTEWKRTYLAPAILSLPELPR